MRFDISEIGAIQCQLNFDEDYYLDYLQENGLQDSDDVKKEYIKDQCDYDVTYLDSEYFHDMGEYDTMTIEEIEEEFGDRCAEDVFITCMDGREHDFEIQAYHDSIDINNPNELNAEAIKCLRHGEYFKNCRGFILTNGVVVYTDVEHNMCSKIPGINGTFDFIRLGNIRVLNHGVDIAKPPTEEQKEVLNQVFQSYYGEELYLDLMNDKNGHTGKRYNSCEPYEVMQDIYDYFNSGRLRQNTYESVKIDLNDIKQMVSECVKKILSETMHVVDEKLFGLAEYIYNLIDSEMKKENYSIEIDIPLNQITKLYPYKNPNALKVFAGFDLSFGEMEYYDKKIIINLNNFYSSTKSITISKILHELTHFVNDCEGGIPKVYITNNNSFIKYLKYYLRPTECNARCSAFAYFLKKETDKTKDLEEYENITFLKRIDELIKNIETNENYLLVLQKEDKLSINKIKKIYLTYKTKIFKIYYHYLKEKK